MTKAESSTSRMVAEELTHHALWLRIDRPDVLNALNTSVVTQLGEGLDRAERDPEVHAVVVTATGRAFCAGADLTIAGENFSGDTQADAVEFRAQLGRLLERIEAFSKPVIAAVNGMALAGGLELVLACDVVVAGLSGRMGDAHSNFGLLPGGGASVRLPRKIGPNRAAEMFFTGELYSPDELEAWGLVNQVVEDDELPATVARLVAKISEKSPLGLHRMKKLMRETAQIPVADGLRLELLYSQLHESSADVREGVDAFLNKRSPDFRARS